MSNGNFNFFVADTISNFKLSPDLLVVRTTTSIDGVLVSEKDKIESNPHNVTESDLGTILDSFDVSTFDRFEKYLKTLPSLIKVQAAANDTNVPDKPSFTLADFDAVTKSI